MFKKAIREMAAIVLGITVLMNGETGEVIRSFTNQASRDAVIKIYPRQNKVEFFRVIFPEATFTLEEFKKIHEGENERRWNFEGLTPNRHEGRRTF
jgi:hypothetical protein